MKKIFTLIVALIGLAGVASASTVDDIQTLKHSYVFTADDYTSNGTGTRTKGGLFGDDHFLDVTGGSVTNGKGSINLSVVDDYGIVTQAIADKYGADYPDAHLNSLRLKNAQDVIAFKATAGSKIIIFYQNNGKDRYPYFAKDAALNDAYAEQGKKYIAYDKEGVDKAHSALARIEWTVPADADGAVTYVGSKGGDMFLSYIIVEANEAEGTPLIKVGAQQYEDGLYFKQVTITPTKAYGSETVVQYTTDGTEPTATNGTLYTGPFKVYNEATVKAVPYLGSVAEGLEVLDGTGTKVENDAAVNFKFNAPTIEDDGNGNVTITSEYPGAKNFASYLDKTDVEGSSFTLTESANVTAYSEITNGSHGTFESEKASKNVYVLSPVSNAKLNFGKAAIEVDEEKTTETSTAYKFSDPSAIAPKSQFFFNAAPQVKIVNDAQYQIDGDSVYLGMGNAENITFKVAEGDSINVTVVTSKNSCKNIDDTTVDEKTGTYKSLANYVNVDGTVYGFDNTPDNFQNVIKFGLGAGIHTFRKYSGTGNILVHDITIEKVGGATPVAGEDYDFAAAVGENLEWNLNPSKTAAPFRINKKAGAEDRQERNFRGYQNYTGTILPAVCNVYFVRPFAQDSVNGGLTFTNESYLAVDSLTDNAVITIEYTNTNDSKLIYAPGNKLQTEATVDGAVAETGVTEVASGAPVTITKAVTGGNGSKTDDGVITNENNAAYTCFRIPKNTTIKKITVEPGNGNTTTGIKNVNAAENVNGLQKPVKVIENGRLVIKTANGTFAIDGSRLK